MFFRFIIFFVGIFLLAISPVFAKEANITHIQLNANSSGTQIVFSLDELVQPRIFALTHPDRLVLDFDDTHLKVNLKKLSYAGPIKLIWDGYPKPNRLRLVIDLTASVNMKNKVDIENNQIQIDLSEEADKLRHDGLGGSSQLRRDKVSMIVVIDPGHGGHDTGAIGMFGTEEKNIVLAIAKQLAELLAKKPDIHVILTRHNDNFVSLYDRLQCARKNKADIFISIHADAYFNDNANGASVYALSPNGATSLNARWLALRENHSELGGVDLSNLSDQSIAVRSVLIDLAQTATNTNSLRLGNKLLNGLDNVTELHYARVEQAPFMVLKSPAIPSILVEVGFISNSTEELHLRDEVYQHKIAMALFTGITDYKKRYF